MGTILQPYGIKLSKIKLVFDSKDQALFDKITQTDDFDYYAMEDEEWMSNNDITTEESLKTIIFGGERKGSGFTYGYALELIVKQLGTSLTYEGDVFAWSKAFDEANELLSSHQISLNLNNMLDKIYDFDIPPIEDFPIIGGLSKEKIAYLKVELDKIEIDKDEVDYQSKKFNEVKEKIYVFRRSVNYCFDNEMDWITFAH